MEFTKPKPQSLAICFISVGLLMAFLPYPGLPSLPSAVRQVMIGR